MKQYRRKVNYYETDMMGMVHHSNYIRWMEEARIDYMDQLGFSYAQMEADGIYSPVISVACEYKHPCTFGEEITVSVSAESFNGVVLKVAYEMKNRKDELICTGRSEHVFMHKGGSFVRPKREMAAFCEAIEKDIRGEI